MGVSSENKQQNVIVQYKSQNAIQELFSEYSLKKSIGQLVQQDGLTKPPSLGAP
jgi:hypothetical protein